MRLRSLWLAIFIAGCLAACRERKRPRPPAGPQVPAAGAVNSGDSLSYTAFLDSLIRRDEIRYDPPLAVYGQEGDWTDEEGFAMLEPTRFCFGQQRFFLRAPDMQVVNEDGDRLYGIRYDTDTAFTFRFNGRRYGWAVTSYYMCNGTGCLERYYLLADFQRHRLYAFVTMALPTYNNYFGDVNRDGKLDVLLPDYYYYPGSRLPYGDTTEYLSLTPYTQDSSGTMQAIREDGRDCQYIIRFWAENTEARDFRVLGRHGTFWQ